jgi:hypothetical protein
MLVRWVDFDTDQYAAAVIDLAQMVNNTAGPTGFEIGL